MTNPTEPQYQPLGEGDVLQERDEYSLVENLWNPVFPHWVGSQLTEMLLQYRRPIKQPAAQDNQNLKTPTKSEITDILARCTNQQNNNPAALASDARKIIVALVARVKELYQENQNLKGGDSPCPLLKTTPLGSTAAQESNPLAAAQDLDATPRTDAMTRYDAAGLRWIHPDDACQLERELNIANAEIERLKPL